MQDEIPEDLAHLDYDAQQRAIIIRASWQMALGTILVLLFSDPMVDCLAALGERLGISSFYISFVLAPLASNASELLAAYRFALKKTKATITVSLSQLEGAAIMNNTFCLGVFMLLIYFQKLEWVRAVLLFYSRNAWMTESIYAYTVGDPPPLF
jgi:Ca2+/Na+ antiporter